ncbi:YidC/Oxa1 family insertase periplasmic-domain containing protein [Rhodopirellula baltica]|uniref:Membrane protein insertase YidC n=1 Tax=Rhodopirellula baltica WH47 TaxID=991778 RepID=F2ATY2_RHOBT|nr:YidC/Oxa1 family insertase periplasmic-domain containing protein [Rhodopirellula baltica]EGF26966.1 60 kDa inner membrane insertion protein [Rhodopirellula baltica WH47]
MERRLFSFILSSMAFFLIYMSLRTMFAPPLPPEEDAIAEVDGETVEPVEDLVADTDASEPGEGDGEEANEDTDAVERPSSPTWSTLGSMDPTSGYVMLVTLNSRGGGIERIELTERKENGRLKYRRVDVRSGYLGYLAADPTATDLGIRVNVVGPGTPADLATASGVQGGLKPRDIITGFNQNNVNNLSMLREAMLETKPGESATVTVLRNEKSIDFTTTLTEHPLDLVRLAEHGGDDEVEGNLSRLSCLLTVGRVGRREIQSGEKTIEGMVDTGDLIWDASQDGDNVSYQLQLSDSEMKPASGKSVGLQRTYSLKPNSYSLDMDVQIDNRAEEAQELAYRIEGANGITLEGWWYSNKISPNWGGSAARDIVYKTTAEGHELVSGYALLKRAKNESEADDQTLFAPDSAPPARNLSYIGVDAQYFTVAMLPPEGQESLKTFRRAAANIIADPSAVPDNKERAVNASFYLDSAIADVPPGSSLKQSLRLFAGPKQPDVMEAYGLGDCIYYGWFSFVAKPLGGLLHLFSNVGNYALAIVLLTLCVRGLMFPLSRKAAINAQRMQELAPELKKIAEKHKDDMEARVRAQRELQQRVGFNPMAGCAPMFLQLPIFIGLYRTLSVDIELRQAAFASWTAWASNLAAPDMMYYWGDWMWDYLGGRGTGWLGPYFNILPMIVVSLFLAQQKMFMPPATDEQTAMTQKMMNYMTLVMGLFFFRVPAGLCIYFITSSLWGIGERILVKKTLPSKPHFDPATLQGAAAGGGTVDGKVNNSAGANGKKSSDGKPKTMADRLRERLGTPEEEAAPLPKDRKRPPSKKPGNKKRR